VADNIRVGASGLVERRGRAENVRVNGFPSRLCRVLDLGFVGGGS
jgi:hypothetical protein